jgi:amidohydrolase
MKQFTLFVLAVLPVFAKAQPGRAKVDAAIAQVMTDVVAWRRDIHQHPELGNREFRTAGMIAANLKSFGIAVTEKVAHTGVVGILIGGKPGPVVALRADIDALPVTERTAVPFASTVTTEYNGNKTGVMHACGHDTHVAMLLGVAKVLSGMRQDIKGTIKFIFQPAEEGVPRGEEGGAELMVKQGVLENPRVDVIFGLHIAAQLEVGRIAYRPGGYYASVNDLKITVKGRSAHGAAPWYAVDPIVAAAQIVNNLQAIVSRNLNVTEHAGIVTIGAFNGGNRSNIIPEKVEMLGTIRALSNEDEKLLTSRVREVAEKTAASAGATAEVLIPYSTHYPITYNDPALTTMMLPSLQQTGGAANVFEQQPHTGGEDFSFYQQKIPGLFINVGGMPRGADGTTTASHHTPDFFIDESGFETGVKALAHLALDYMAMHAQKK